MNRSGRRPLQAVGLAALTLLVSWIGWSRGRKTGTPGHSEYQVTGRSMMPTLKGTHRRLICPNCRVEITAPASPSLELGRESFPCWHCGQGVPVGEEPIRSGDIVRLNGVQSDRTSLHVGQLVAIDWEGRRQIKRVFALPGDTVDLDAGRRLLINGQRLEDLLAEQGFESRATVPVDFDALREESRWKPQGDGPWQRVDRQWRVIDSDSPGWLIYSHQAVYDQFRAAPIYDDYPGNIDVTRSLNIAQCLFIRFDFQPIDVVEKIEVAFWTSDGPVVVERGGDSGDIVVGQREGTKAEHLPVEITSPVAIRVLGGSAKLARLALGRDVGYRLRESDSSGQYPLSLAAGECFLVGDNVPISIDSRTRGAARLSRVIGVIDPSTR